MSDRNQLPPASPVSFLGSYRQLPPKPFLFILALAAMVGLSVSLTCVLINFSGWVVLLVFTGLIALAFVLAGAAGLVENQARGAQSDIGETWENIKYTGAKLGRVAVGFSVVLAAIGFFSAQIAPGLTGLLSKTILGGILFNLVLSLLFCVVMAASALSSSPVRLVFTQANGNFLRACLAVTLCFFLPAALLSFVLVNLGPIGIILSATIQCLVMVLALLGLTGSLALTFQKHK